MLGWDAGRVEGGKDGMWMLGENEESEWHKRRYGERLGKAGVLPA